MLRAPLILVVGRITMPESPPLISVVVTNYNYAPFLRRCIESVLSQDYVPLEVIVVDDGSTDGSRSVIDSFGNGVVAMFKSNGGHASAMNVGFKVSRGDVIVFVDADDYLLPGALRAHAQALQCPEAVRSHGYLDVIDAEDRSLDMRLPGRTPGNGDLLALTLKRGPGAYVSTPNTGNAWKRWFLEHVFPLPETIRGVGAEPYLMDTAPIFGSIVTVSQSVGAYRSHSAGMSLQTAKFSANNIEKVIKHYEQRSDLLARTASHLGHQVSGVRWLNNNWRLLTLRHLVVSRSWWKLV
jgi:glycosyltransferase involved in cell wall biosynthesis